MPETKRIYQAANEILQEIENFGKYRMRKGSPLYNKALGHLKEKQVVIQSRRTNSPYWYPGANFNKAKSLGAKKFFRTVYKRKIQFLLENAYTGKKGRFITGLVLGIFLGAIVTYLLL